MLVCSICNIPLCQIEYEGVVVRFCPDCGGALVEDGCLGTIDERRVRRWSADEKRTVAREALAADTPGPIRCPECLMPMAKKTVPVGRHAFHLDHCGACGLYWFDRGELELVQMIFEKHQDEMKKHMDLVEKRAIAEMQLAEEAHPISEGIAGPSATARFSSSRFYMGGGRSWAPAYLAAGLVSLLVSLELRDLESPSEFQRRRAVIRILVGVAILAVLGLLLYVLVR